MSLQNKIETKLSEALKAQDKKTYSTLRLIVAGIKDTIIQSTNLSQQGDLTIVQGTARWYAPFNLQMLQVVPRLGTAADAAVGIVIEKNDSDHTTFQFGAGVTEVILDSSNNIPFNMTESDYLTVDVTSIGNTNKGKDLIVQFRYKAT